MKGLAAVLLITLSAMAFAAPVTVPMDDASIDVAIDLANNHPGTFSTDGTCAKNEFDLIVHWPTHNEAEVKMTTSRGEDVLVEEERAAALDMVIRLGVPMIDTGCQLRIGRVKITGSGCGFSPQQWSASYESIQ